MTIGEKLESEKALFDKYMRGENDHPTRGFDLTRHVGSDSGLGTYIDEDTRRLWMCWVMATFNPERIA